MVGRVVEVFSGIQGEGTRVGERHIFLRLAGCNLACRYCDQPEARRIPRLALIEQTPGRRDFTSTPNPIAAVDLARAVLALHRPRRLHRALAVTGGEPLLQADFLADLLPRVRRCGLRVLLETNGALPDALRALLPCLDIVSMDLKLRSATGRPMPARAHETFLRLATRGGVQVYAKAVVTSSATLREVGRAQKPVLLKRGLSATIDEFLWAAEYIVSEGNGNVILCERGIRTFERQTRNTLDISAVPILRQMSFLPVIVDVSHAAGRKDILAPLGRAALAAGANGLMVEVHPVPAVARSDSRQQFDLEEFARFLKEIGVDIASIRSCAQ